MTSTGDDMKPKHYADMAVDPLEVMANVLTDAEYTGFLKGSIIKYAMRAGHKEGSDDLAKCKFYEELLAENRF
jgi:hypothetical protein